jgi:hypothetical protein
MVRGLAGRAPVRPTRGISSGGHNKMSKLQRAIIIYVLAAIIMVAGALAYRAWQREPETVNPPDEITVIDITNFTDQVQNLPESARRDIENALHGIVRLNAPDGIAPDVSDAAIRDSSYTQEYLEEDDIYHTHFIVDIASIRQSFQVNHLYFASGRPGGYYYDDYSSIVACLDYEDLIYGDFKCLDGGSGGVQGNLSPTSGVLATHTGVRSWQNH